MEAMARPAKTPRSAEAEPAPGHGFHLAGKMRRVAIFVSVVHIYIS
jgi:hypothetical protein